MDADASEYERSRLENIRRNQELLRSLQSDRVSAAFRSASAPKLRVPRVPRAKREKKKDKKESSTPRRTSSRLAGIPADTATTGDDGEGNATVGAKRERTSDGWSFDKVEEAERAKRQRVAGDLSFEIKRGLFADKKGWDTETFTKDDVDRTADGGLKEVRKRMMGLKLWEKFEPNGSSSKPPPISRIHIHAGDWLSPPCIVLIPAELKITPERIYHLEFHPNPEKPLIFAADKVGNFGILSAADDDADEPDITQFKPHARTITNFFVPPSAPETLYTASYDCSIRRLDLNRGKSVEVYVHPDEAAFSAVNALDAGCRALLFATLDGEVGRIDTRAKGPAEIWECSEKKIGGCHVLPRDPNYFSTASLDRTVKIWDIRAMRRPVVQHSSRLSVSSAMWSPTGKLATTSYDDTIKIYNPTLPRGGAAATTAGAKTRRGNAKIKVKTEDEDEERFVATTHEIEPEHVIRHNNQTGRWVTILKANWQEQPEDGVQKLVVANMNRGIDVYGDDGVQLAHLADDSITAVPSAAKMHPSRSWVAGGTASGKIVLFK